MGILIAIGVCICAIGPHKRVKKVKKPQPAVQTRKSFVYKGKWAYDAATREYRRLYGKSENEELTDEENNKIYDYTMMPLSYFFGWLCERDLIGEGFAEEFGEDKAKEIIESIKTHRRTPLEVLADLDYYFTEDWLKKEAKYFLWLYFEARDNYYTDDDVYLYDYYECNGDPDNRFFCMEYSFDVQQKINRLIDDRYADNNNSPNYSDGEYYSDDEDEDAPVVTIHSTLFDKDLEVERAGRIIKGVFPDDYARKCVKCLDNMSQKEWHRLERWIMDNYGVEASEAKIDKFGAYSISIYEPEYDGDLAFIINGGADYEEEHGVSITIRNGILLDWGYYMESREPYDEELVKRYEMYTGEIDFENLTNQSELESFVSQGKLIRTQMLPKSLGGEDSSDNMVVVTPEAYEHMQRIIKRLKTIQTYANSTYINGELRVVAKAEYQVNAKGTKLLVPMSVSYNTPNTPNKKSLRIFMWTKVWE